MADQGDDLRPLTAEEREEVGRYPLPDGVPDGVLNKAQLATALDVSETTLGQWLRKGLPVEEGGTNGRAYVFRLSLAWAWVARMRAEEDARRSHGDSVAAQMQLALLGGDSAAPVDGKMTLAEQRKALELELIRTQAARQRGELVRRVDMVSATEDAFAAIRDALDGLPDRLVRECGLDGRGAEAAQIACDDILRGAVRAVAEVFGNDGDASGTI